MATDYRTSSNLFAGNGFCAFHYTVQEIIIVGWAVIELDFGAL